MAHGLFLFERATGVVVCFGVSPVGLASQQQSARSRRESLVPPQGNQGEATPHPPGKTLSVLVCCCRGRSL